jgi:hypothetical protein
MSIDTYGLDRDAEGDVTRRHAPRCYTRPAMADSAPSRINAENVALAVALAAISCAGPLIVMR